VEHETGERPLGRRITFVVGAYAAWFAACGLAAGLGVVGYLVLTGLYWLLGLDARAFKLFAILLALGLGAGWFVAAGWTEHFLAQAPGPAVLRRRATRLLGGGALVLGIGYLAARLLPPPS
jgi:hypothetical protein